MQFIVYKNKLKYFFQNFQMISIENCNELKTEYLNDVKNNVSRKKKQKENNNTKMRGLFISAKGDNRNSHYLYGTLNNFMEYLRTNAGEKHLCNDYEYIGHSFPYGQPKNKLIYKYLHKEIFGDVIIIRKDKADIDYSIHRNLSTLSDKVPKIVKYCSTCYHLLNDFELNNYCTKSCYIKDCDFCKSKNNHGNYFCTFCYNYRYNLDKNINFITKNIKFLTPWDKETKKYQEI